MKERIKEITYWLEDKLKELCGEITPDKRLVVILIMLLFFTIGNLYFTFSAFYNWGKESERKEQVKIKNIKQLELDSGRIKELIDSNLSIPMITPDNINQQKQEDYGRSNKG